LQLIILNQKSFYDGYMYIHKIRAKSTYEMENLTVFSTLYYTTANMLQSYYSTFISLLLSLSVCWHKWLCVLLLLFQLINLSEILTW